MNQTSNITARMADAAWIASQMNSAAIETDMSVIVQPTLWPNRSAFCSRVISSPSASVMAAVPAVGGSLHYGQIRIKRTVNLVVRIINRRPIGIAFTADDSDGHSVADILGACIPRAAERTGLDASGVSHDRSSDWCTYTFNPFSVAILSHLDISQVASTLAIYSPISRELLDWNSLEPSPHFA